MIPNLINTLVGISLVYAAVLEPSRLRAGSWTICITGLLILLLAVWARRTDYAKWHSSTSIVLGLVLILSAAMQFVFLSEAAAFWVAFWIGITVAVISLWAALYKPSQGQPAARAA